MAEPPAAPHAPVVAGSNTGHSGARMSAHRFAPGAAPSSWRDNRRLARVAAGVAVAAALVRAATSEQVIDSVVHQMRDDRSVNYTPLVGYSTPTSGLVAIGNIAALALVVVVTWRLAGAHRQLGRANTRWGQGWAIAGRLIPVAQAVLPALQLDELWRGSEPGTARDDPGWRLNRRSPLPPVLVVVGLAQVVAGIVAGAYTVAAMFDTVTDAFLVDDRSARELADAVADGRPWRITSNLLGIAIALITAWLLVQIAERQQRCHEADLAAGRVVGVTDLTGRAAYGGPAGAPPYAWPPGWYPDPWGQAAYRWWDGTGWTASVSAPSAPPGADPFVR